MNDKTIRRQELPDGTVVKEYAAKPTLVDKIKDHSTPLIITAVLTGLGGLIWSGGMAYLNTLHIQRVEYEQDRKLETVKTLEGRIHQNNKEIRRYRAYNRSDDPDGKFVGARTDEIEALQDDNEALERELERMSAESKLQ